MPNIKICGNQFNVKPMEDNAKYLESFSTTLSRMTETESNLDITIHCQDKSTLRASKVILANCSVLLRNIFNTSTCHCPATLDLICPDFDSRAMRKVLELINHGSTNLTLTDRDLLKEMKLILASLQIDSLVYLLKSVLDENNDESDQIKIDSKHYNVPTATQPRTSPNKGKDEGSVSKEKAKSSNKKERTTQDLQGKDSAMETLRPNPKKKCRSVCQPKQSSQRVPKRASRRPGQMKFQCHICSKKFVSYSRILSHYTDSHLYMNLREKYPNLQKNCNLCSKDFSSTSRLFYHLTTSHNGLDGLIPHKKSLQIQANLIV